MLCSYLGVCTGVIMVWWASLEVFSFCWMIFMSWSTLVLKSI